MDSTAAPLPQTRLTAGGRLRSAIRLAGIAGWTATAFLLWALGSLPTLAAPRARLRWRQFWVRRWAVGMCGLVGMRRQILGVPPHPPFVLVTNHVSYLDILLLHSVVSGVFIAKRDMRSWPLLGPLANVMGTIWIKRESRRDALRALDQIGNAIGRGDGVVIFPEGTTSSGEGLLPLKPALLDWAARAQYPVHHGVISYRSEPGAPPASELLCWWGGVPFGPHILRVLRNHRFHATVDFTGEPITASTRALLAERLREALLARLNPVE